MVQHPKRRILTERSEGEKFAVVFHAFGQKHIPSVTALKNNHPVMRADRINRLR